MICRGASARFFSDVGIITRQIIDLFRRHTPKASGRRLQDAADLALPLRQGIDEGLPINAERHRPP